MLFPIALARGGAPRFGGLHNAAVKPSLLRLLSAQALPPPPPGAAWKPANFKFVDKSLMQAELLYNETLYPFLLLPAMRRVGKTTALHQLAAMARGDADKFKGYAVCAPDSPYKVTPGLFSVIQLDCSGLANGKSSAKEVEAALMLAFEEAALEQHGITLPSNLPGLGLMMSAWIRALRVKESNRPIVVLIDEYDAPITTLLLKTSVNEAEEFAEKLSTLYSQLKKRGPELHKVLVAGVAKVWSMNMFSSANVFRNLFEVKPKFCTLFGFTEAEILKTYGDVPVNGGKKLLRECMPALKAWYNGYRVHPKQAEKDTLYNPLSVLSFIRKGEITGYWTRTTTSGLNELLRDRGPSILAGTTSTWSELKVPLSIRSYMEDRHWTQRAFQLGYLTIKNAKAVVRMDRKDDYELQLGAPNAEVKDWVSNEMFLHFANEPSYKAYADAIAALAFKRAGKELQKVLEGIKEPREKIRNEAAFGLIALGSLEQMTRDRFVTVRAELDHPVPNSQSEKKMKSDGVLVFNVNGKLHMAVVELKFGPGRSADTALKQIKDNAYAPRALESLKTHDNIAVDEENVYLVGINLSYKSNGKPVITLKAEKYRPN